MTTTSLGPEKTVNKRYVKALRYSVKHIVTFAIIIGLWELLGQTGQLNKYILPWPSLIGAQLIDLFFISGIIYYHFYTTLAEAMIGFFIGITIGISLAVSAAFSPVFRRYIAPYAVIFSVTPGIAVTPMIIAWFGFGWSSKIALAALVCFFPPFVNTLTALTRTDEDGSDLFRSMGASKRAYFWKLQLPNAIPLIVAGLKLGLTGALLGTIVAEFVSATAGVGILMQRFAFKLQIDGSFATLLTMAAMGLMLFTIMEILDYRIVFWKRDVRLLSVSRKRAALWRRKHGNISI
jgi:NitT/TauT family transport system permease protein